jgi:hypothetical protein
LDAHYTIFRTKINKKAAFSATKRHKKHETKITHGLTLFFSTWINLEQQSRNQTKKLKCKTQNFGIPASRDNSLLFKQLRQPCRKNTQKKQEYTRLFYRFLIGLEIRDWLCGLPPHTTPRTRQKMLMIPLKAGLQTILSRSNRFFVQNVSKIRFGSKVGAAAVCRVDFA